MSHCCGDHKSESIQTVVLYVKGMTCNHCVMSIQKGVGEVKGVKKVDVSLEEGKATVEFNPSETSVDAIKIAIEDVGYDVE